MEEENQCKEVLRVKDKIPKMGVHKGRNPSSYLGLILKIVFVHLEDFPLDSGVQHMHINNHVSNM